MNDIPNRLSSCISWYLSESDPGIPLEVKEQYCPRRDTFEARLHRILQTSQSLGLTDDDSALLTAAVGEIGNNCFDHNLGHWVDQPGCLFGNDQSQDGKFYIWIADRGRGLKSSLSHVVNDLVEDQAALDIAFTKKISSRSPERRGNGLKFVRSVIESGSNRGLYAASGSGEIKFGNVDLTLSTSKTSSAGALTVIAWEQS